MTAAWKGAGAYTVGADGNSVALAYPAGIVAGDVLLAEVYKENPSTITPPAGWTALEIVDNVQIFQICRFWTRASGPLSGSATFGWSSATWCDGVIHAYSGAIASGTPVELIDQAIQGDAVAATTPAVSGELAGPDRLVVWTAENYWGGAWTNIPSGWTARINAGDGATSVFTKAFPDGGTVGPVQVTTDLSSNRQKAKAASLVAIVSEPSAPAVPTGRMLISAP